MSNERVAPPHLVKVLPPDPHVGSEMQVWAAMTGADQAVDAVLAKFSPDWKAELIPGGVTKEMAALIKLRHGEVSDLSQAMR